MKKLLILIPSLALGMAGDKDSTINIDLEKGKVTITSSAPNTPPPSPRNKKEASDEQKEGVWTTARVAALTTGISLLTGTITTLVSVLTKDCPK